MHTKKIIESFALQIILKKLSLGMLFKSDEILIIIIELLIIIVFIFI